jgi:hypothetical protein
MTNPVTFVISTRDEEPDSAKLSNQLWRGRMRVSSWIRIVKVARSELPSKWEQRSLPDAYSRLLRGYKEARAYDLPEVAALYFRDFESIAERPRPS